MTAQGLWRVIVAGELCLAECRMDFLVANVMQQNHGSPLAALQLGDQMMKTLRDIPRNRPPAQGACWIVSHSMVPQFSKQDGAFVTKGKGRWQRHS